ncbi:leukocyte antigen CD37 [Alosa sapidissima]|uniref:leukocyte antigen CD37 n=1 Tax=Alosa sapidissima TaxID=34773 RepID=UPI001C08EC6B|nr:leukocyte antigen CD37 [Alosa sapidissima]XP_041938883.1 leukocyte antigen CD37 [Alosa sapidissima]XP_041938884.1 leukocyte antigen CD37 [Alosa sapidissima]
MVSECCLGVTKYLVFLFNLIFFFLGALMLSLGVWITCAESSFFLEPPTFISMSLLSYFLLIGGSLTMTLGFLGCIGAIQEAKCLLGLYFMLLTIVLAAQSVGGVLFITQRSIFESSLMGHMSMVINMYGKNDSHLQHFERTLDYIQQQAECCGWEYPAEWDRGAPCSCYYYNGTQHASNSSTFSSCVCSPTDTTQCVMYKQGCKRQLERWMDDHMLIIMVVLFALIGVEICGMILSMCLYKSHSKDDLFMNY